MGKGRTESFSDGVLAVAITLLALDLHVAPGSTRLWSQVLHQWPSFAAYAVSFYVIGVIWVTHHGLFALITRVDRVLLFENLLLLMFVVAMPFTTATLADFIQSSHAVDARVAVLLYGLSDIGMAFSFTAMFSRVVHHDLLEVPVDHVTARRAVRRFGIGTIGYPAAMVAGLIWPPLILAGIAALTGYYMLEETRVVPIADHGAASSSAPGGPTRLAAVRSAVSRFKHAALGAPRVRPPGGPVRPVPGCPAWRTRGGRTGVRRIRAA